MFKAPKKVKDCPYTRKSNGIVLMSPQLIAELAAAVHDDDEWAIILQGERRKKGYEIEITGYRLPPQTRSSGHVELPEMDLEPDDVLVIHSHHSMGAFFSGTDTGKLNPRFPASIVVAEKKLQYLGFDYKGVGKVVLPCGATGEVDFFIQPTEGPELHSIVEVAHGADDLGDCTNYENKASDKYHVKYVAACGLSESEALVAEAFGADKTLKDLVDKLPRPQLSQQQWQNSGSQSLAGQPMKDFDRCSVCRMVLSSFGWCSKCEKYRGKPRPQTTEQPSWLESLIPDRFKTPKRSAKKPDPPETTVFVGEDTDTGLETVDVYLCRVCGEYQPFENWVCENCDDGTFCGACQEGHDWRTDCRPERLA